jgi:hypothetical protein
MHKSMTLKLHETGELYGEISRSHLLISILEKGKARTERFSKDFVGTLKKLISSLVLQIRDKIQSSFTVAKFLNINIALFLKDLLAIVDRGVVFQLVISLI